MEPNKILSASLIDMIFDGRNKEYGAYNLRDTYPRRIKKAVIFTTVIAAIAFGGAALASSSKKKKVEYAIGPEVTLADYQPKEIPPKEIPEPVKPPEAEPTRTVAYTAPVIVPEDQIEKPLSPIENLDSAIIGTITTEGKPDVFIARPPDQPATGGDPNGIVQPKKELPDDGPVPSVDIPAQFDGNWKRFLETNLNAETPVENGAPAGRYSVVVQFVVNKEGLVSEIKPLTNHGYGVEQEAVRVLKKAPKWRPAILNGSPVKAFNRQVIVFEVTE